MTQHMAPHRRIYTPEHYSGQPDRLKAYQDGYNAYNNREPILTNPYMLDPNEGLPWAWSFGWHQALADHLFNLDYHFGQVDPRNPLRPRF